MTKPILVGILRSDDYYPTLGIPVFEVSDGERYVAEEHAGRVKHFESVEVDASRFVEGNWGVLRGFSVGDEAVYALVISQHEIMVGDLEYLRSHKEQLDVGLEGFPFFQMEYFDLIGDRVRFQRSALRAATSLKKVGTYLLNTWLQCGNLDADTIDFVVSNIDDGISGEIQQTDRLQIHGPAHFVGALQRVLRSSGSVLADSEIRLDLAKNYLDKVLADTDFMRAMVPISQHNFCKMCGVSFVNQLNIDVVNEEYMNVFADDKTIEPLFTNHTSRKIDQMIHDHSTHPVFGNNRTHYTLRAVACAIHHHRSEILDIYQQAIKFDVDHARQEILNKIDMRLNG